MRVHVGCPFNGCLLSAVVRNQTLPVNAKMPKIDADHSGTIDGREAAKLLGKSGLTREQLKTVWGLADKNDKGELDHDGWAVAMHLSRQGN